MHRLTCCFNMSWLVGSQPLLVPVILITCLFFSMGTPAHSQGDVQQMPTRVKDPVIADCLAGGNKAAEEGNLDQAVKIFSGCVEKHPSSPDAHFLLGMAYFFKQDLESATGEFKKAFQLDGNNLDAAAMLGRIYSFDKQKLALARELLERVLSAAPYKDDVRFDLARVYAQQGEEQKCLNEFRIILGNERKYVVYHTEFARILVAAEKKPEAVQHLKRALALDPDFEPAKKLLESLETSGKEPAKSPEPAKPR